MRYARQPGGSRDLHLVYAIDSLNSGGAQRQAVELAAHLRTEAGARVSFFVYHDFDFYEPRLREAGVPVVRFPKRARLDAGLPLRIRRWLRENPVDILHAFLPAPALWNYLAIRAMPARERPLFVAAERSCLAEVPRWAGWVAKWLYPRCDAVTANAESEARVIHERIGVPAERIHYIPNGIDLGQWDRDAEQEPPLEMDPTAFQLALVGGLREEKNHRLVLEALTRIGPARTRNWRVWFIGAETSSKAFADGIRRDIAERNLGSVVRIAPPTPKIAAVMRRLDGVLLPSRFEGFPNVALEAMASRVPVITSRVGDIPNMIEDGLTGFILDKTDAASLVDSILQLNSLSRSGRGQMGERARAAVEARYSMPIVAARYLELYRWLTRQKQAS